VLFVQELTGEAAARLQRAGLSALLPHSTTQTVAGGGGGGIYARYPFGDGLAVPPASLAQLSARLDLPSGQSVQLVCVHSRPPKPWLGGTVARWRGELSMLPPPGDTPVILAGDFNATFDHAQLRGLLRLGHQDAALQAGNALVPTWRPETSGCPALLAIDHILIDPRCAVRATSVHRLPSSDHRALFARLRLPLQAGRSPPGRNLSGCSACAAGPLAGPPRRKALAGRSAHSRDEVGQDRSASDAPTSGARASNVWKRTMTISAAVLPISG
jgi:Endonuclease/Exonuclease/phosphatase family